MKHAKGFSTLGLALEMFLSGCGGSHTPPPPNLTVSVTTNSPPVLMTRTADFTAIVTNDPYSKGVTWSVSCASAPCGTVSPSTTASGVATLYTAPPTPPLNDLTVKVLATSVANSAKSNFATVTIRAITISVDPLAAGVGIGSSKPFIATVSNDLSNQGVNWTLTQGASPCSPACGTVDSVLTDSGSPVTYAAPASFPASPTLTLTATSVSDPTKSGSATITISTVALAPATLDFGSVSIGKSDARSTVLTNKGSSTLTIQSMTLSGADPHDFSIVPGNQCGTSVPSGSSCTISVTFTPARPGTRTANLAISDTAAGPQVIPLTGTGFIHCTQQIRQTLSSSPVRTALATLGTATVPAPTGPSTVGTRILHLVDSRRDDPFLENGSKRELMVRFWYPATLDQACKHAEYTPASVWSYFSQLMGLPLPAVSTNSCLEAPVADGVHPVVIFTHGYTGTFTDYTFILEDLASRGYVVASVDHTYEATAVQFPDGKFVHSGFGSHLGKILLEDEEALAFALVVRLDDLKFVAQELDRVNRSADSPFSGKLDVSKMAIVGHSMGGLAASLAVEREPLFKAALILDVHDGSIPDAIVGGTRKPVFILASGRQQWTENECQLWNNLRGPRVAMNLKGAEHLTPTDAVWLAKYAVKTGTMGPDKSIAAVRDYIAAFLGTYLLDRPLDALLSGPSAEYPDAAVVTQERSLCTNRSDYSSKVRSTRSGGDGSR